MIITENVIGKIKELNGVNCSPYSEDYGENQPHTNQIFGYCGITYCRTHDVNGYYGGSYYIDIPNIFKDFSADENDANNYDFYYTDEYIKGVLKANAKIVYRLGVTIEWGTKKYRANPPSDYSKWARVCEHIIAHYNHGWANGYYFGIEYWEIWNEPENPPMWTGTKDQFLELYKVSSRYLKSKLPEIKIGGYGSCGFYAAFRMGLSDFMKGFLTWFDDFLKMCKKDNCPLDFFSWHIYTSKTDEIIKSAKYVREKLDEYGFIATESHLNEWNYGAEGGGFDNMATMIGASFIAKAFIDMQNSVVDKAMYYALNYCQGYNAFWDIRTKDLTPVAHVYWAFNKLFQAGSQLEVKTGEFDPSVIVATDNIKKYALITNYQSKKKIFQIQVLCNENKSGKIYRLTENYGFVFDREFNVDNEWIYTAPNTVYLFEI